MEKVPATRKPQVSRETHPADIAGENDPQGQSKTRRESQTGAGMIFVFGSNEAGIHGGGAARDAYHRWGATYGQGNGRSGSSYAIPTKDKDFNPLPIKVIEAYVDDFIRYATHMKDEYFVITRVGCGLAGYNDQQIAPLFRGVPENCHIPIQWAKILSEQE